MTAAAAAADAAAPKRRVLLRRWWPLAALAVAVVALSLFVNRAPSNGLPFDPSSTDPNGTKALAMILDRVGAEVSVLDGADDLAELEDLDTLLVLVDNLDERSDDAITRFVEGGGTALVADYSGRLAENLRPAGSASDGFIAPTLERRCSVPALDGINRVRPGSAPLFVVPEGATGCFGRDDRAWLIIAGQGDGTLITTGGPTFLINSLIGEVDNAPLAVALLAPDDETRVGILRPSFALAGDGPGEGGGATTLGALIPVGIKAAGAQLTLAFGVVVLWRMRRLGKPVREPQPVRLAGSELVAAVGQLFQRTGARERATQLLRDDFRRSVSGRLGVAGDLPAEDLADLAALRTGADREQLHNALAGPAPATDAALVELAQRIEALRTDIVQSATVSPGARSASTK